MITIYFIEKKSVLLLIILFVFSIVIWLFIEMKSLRVDVISYYVTSGFTRSDESMWIRRRSGKIDVGRWGGNVYIKNPSIYAFATDGSRIDIKQIEHLDYTSSIFGAVSLGESLIFEEHELNMVNKVRYIFNGSTIEVHVPPR